MAPHSSTLAWKIPRKEEPVGLPSMGRTESDTTEVTYLPYVSRNVPATLLNAQSLVSFVIWAFRFDNRHTKETI